MRLIFSKVLILAFISLAVFGLFGMGDMNGSHVNCIASEIQNGNCPVANTLFSFAGFHLNALKIFSSAVFGANILSLIIALFLIRGFIGLLKFKFLIPVFARESENLTRLNLLKAGWKFSRWLSFRENSPSFVVCGVKRT